MLKSLILLIFLQLTQSQLCPPPEVLAPCKCHESGLLRIGCEDIREDFNLKEVFDNASSYVSDSTIFDYLIIRLTPLRQIPDDAVQHLKFKNIQIFDNPNLVYISPRAFQKSLNVTNYLTLGYNSVSEQNPFDVSMGFEKLTSLFGYFLPKSFTVIPSNAVESHANLELLQLDQGHINFVGSWAFAAALNLKTLSLFQNPLANDGFAPDAFHGIANGVEVNLQLSQMDSLNQTVFEPLLERRGKLVVGGIDCGNAGCDFIRWECDQRYSWLCEKGYHHQITGFYCTSESGYDNFAEYCEQRKKQIQ